MTNIFFGREVVGNEVCRVLFREASIGFVLFGFVYFSLFRSFSFHFVPFRSVLVRCVR